MYLNNIKNKEAFLEIYGYIPSFQKAYLHEVVVHQDGPHLVLRFDIEDFPKSPPYKWVESGFNRVQVQLEIWSFDSLFMEGFQTENLVTISLSNHESGLAFSISGTTTITGIAKFAFIQSVTAYTAID